MAEWGAILTYFYCGERIVSYLHPNLRPLVLVTGILLVFSAGCVLLWDEACSQAACNDDGCATRHGKMTLGSLLSFAVLVLPIAFATKISPDSFGSAFIENRGVRKTIFVAKAHADRWEKLPMLLVRGGRQVVIRPVSLDLQMRKPPASAVVSRKGAASPANDDCLAVGILDLMRAAQNPFVRQAFEGRRVGLTGRFFPKNANHFELVCTFITCCAVDAQLLAVRVETDDIPTFEKLAWTKVVGRVNFVKIGEDTMPVIAADTIAKTPAPREPLVYGPNHPVLRQ